MQLEMFAKPPRATPLKRAHVSDAVKGQGDFPYGGQFTCARCTWESDWLCFDTISEMKRGIPCPKCNSSTENLDAF